MPSSHRHKSIACIALVVLVSTGISCDRGKFAKPLEVWGQSGRGPGELAYPRVLTRDAKTGHLATIDKAARVQIFDARGNFLNGWDMPESSIGRPVGATFAPDGLLWIADTHYHRVMVYDTGGTLIRQIGKQGTGPGEFNLPCDIAFEESSGRYFISEYGGTDRIQVFESNGDFVRAIGGFGFDPGRFSRPQSIVVVEGELFVADACNHRISVFDTSTGVHLRDIASQGIEAGEVRFPYGLDVDEAGVLVVSEFANARLQWFDRKSGQSLGTWGSAGKRSGELAFPWALASNQDGTVWVLDSGNDRLQRVRRPSAK